MRDSARPAGTAACSNIVNAEADAVGDAETAGLIVRDEALRVEDMNGSPDTKPVYVQNVGLRAGRCSKSLILRDRKHLKRSVRIGFHSCLVGCLDGFDLGSVDDLCSRWDLARLGRESHLVNLGNTELLKLGRRDVPNTLYCVVDFWLRDDCNISMVATTTYSDPCEARLFRTPLP